MIGLPDAITACLFDLDGVLTGTATQHEAAWRKAFDGFLAGWSEGDRRPFSHQDYLAHVDGRPRADGVRTFLAARHIDLPEGSPEDPPDLATVHGVGNHKNDLLLATIAEQGVEPYVGSVAYLKAATEAGLAIAVVTSSANGEAVLAAAHLDQYVQARIDGLVITRDGLAGKPAPDSYLAGAAALGVKPEHAAVFEDALSGVTAGKAGGFGYIVGVDRVGQADALRAQGADIVVADLADLLVAP